MWRRKANKQEKLARRVQSEKRRRENEPTRVELKNKQGAEEYSRRRGLSRKATQRVVDLVTGVALTTDWSDQRTVPPCDRVPRSLEATDTPPRFWDVTDPLV